MYRRTAALAALTILAALVGCADASAQSYAKAQMLYENGLTTDAQHELIDLVFANGTPADKAKSLDLLATIAVENGRFKAALDSWNRLIKEYPQSAEAKRASEHLPLLAGVIGQVTGEGINDAAASIYLRSADFWSKGRDRIFTIDSSWIPQVEAAIFWYDKAISDFPGSGAARLAYEEKMRTILGWKEPGQYSEPQGLQASASYFPQLEATFRAYEKAFPTASAAQGFRFMIAQGYWKKKNWAKTREWLNEIISKDAGANSFFKDLAERRLKKIEY